MSLATTIAAHVRRMTVRLAGSVVLWASRDRGRFYERLFTGTARSGLVERLACAELQRRYYASSDAEIRALNRRWVWGGSAGRQWLHVSTARAMNPDAAQSELRWRQWLTDQIVALVTDDPRYTTVCEVGTGNGIYLGELASRLPAIERFVGLDLNAEQIAENRLRRAGPRLQFEHVEAAEWLRRCGRSGTIVVAYGTFEYFTEKELTELLMLVRAVPAPVALAVADTVRMDLASERRSVPRGHLTFSHNYPHLVAQCGFRIHAQKITPVQEDVAAYAQVALVAVLP